MTWRWKGCFDKNFLCVIHPLWTETTTDQAPRLTNESPRQRTLCVHRGNRKPRANGDCYWCSIVRPGARLQGPVRLALERCITGRVGAGAHSLRSEISSRSTMEFLPQAGVRTHIPRKARANGNCYWCSIVSPSARLQGPVGLVLTRCISGRVGTIAHSRSIKISSRSTME